MPSAAIGPLIIAMSLLAPAAQAANSVLWGYGVRSCGDYLSASTTADTGQTRELQRYEDWLTGFLSGLNLALGEDVLRGSGLSTAMQQVRATCKSNPKQDFFNASMGIVRHLRGNQ